MEEVHNRKQHLGKREGLREYKKSDSNEGRLSAEVKRQEKLDIVEKKNLRREKLLEKYIAKILYRWNDGKFKKEYLRKLERNWEK